MNGEAPTRRRDDSQPLTEFVASIPPTLAWVKEQEAAGACPRCGDPFDGGWPGCTPLVMSVWCQTVRRHIVPPAETPVGAPPVTSYSSMAERGREESLAVTKGRRKRTGERIEYVERDRGNVTAFPGVDIPPSPYVEGRLIGSCGHVLRRVAAVPVVDGVPRPGFYLTTGLGRKVTCQHDDCMFEPKPVREERDTDCTWVVGLGDSERRCRTTAKWATELGPVCTQHRNHLRREGYLDSPGEAIVR